MSNKIWELELNQYIRQEEPEQADKRITVYYEECKEREKIEENTKETDIVSVHHIAKFPLPAKEILNQWQ